MSYDAGDSFTLSLRAVDRSLAIGHQGTHHVSPAEPDEAWTSLMYEVEEISEEGYRCRVLDVE